MVAKILIKREFKPGKRVEILNLFNNLRSAALKQKGYISGLTLTNPEDSNKTLVISTWQSLEDWNQWKEHPERQRLETMLEIYLENQTTYEIYVMGGAFTK